ncbi:NFACT RNA binding domain-containing protein [Hymenobacter weizhouensis]|uniref:NFACT RNA binding domain-containing protein n=1 Tax=Hymenobacter sp. YIM 151500-1 TaxID=2987689 RepID=UPI0022263E3B|nr:NFACT RNA binding domain-containing protein [Hymenobacter sp. YIM 151500-1]UYZ63723.1 NFACT RNA binding domain-containing protein [Hymenobacter sp. YIM 151500-1]
MHTNYYFLRQLAPALTRQLASYAVVACFSQEKDELVLGLTNGKEEFWLRVLLAAAGPLVSLPETFHRARQNSVDLLPELPGQQVADVTAWPQDRVLQFTFQSGATLVLKLYSTRPNAIFRPTPDAPAQLFHQRYTADAELASRGASPPSPLSGGEGEVALELDSASSKLEISSPSPPERGLGGEAPREANPLKVYPSLGDLTLGYLRTQGYDPAPLERKWELVRGVVQELENPMAFYIVRHEGRTRLSLLPVGEVEETLPATDPIGALRRFVPLLLGRRSYEAERRQVQQQLEKRADEAATSAQHARRRLHQLEHTAGHRQTADLIMAHLSQIPAGAAQVEVVDFYQNNQPRLIKLKPTETPQRTAQNLYRKAKNQQLETRELTARAERRDAEALWCLERLEELATLPPGDLRALRQWRKQHGLDAAATTKAAQELPFKVFEDSGFTILVGRNAQNNDLLTQRYAHKDDLWLHAKDVTGSHVVIRQQPGRPVPEPVLERAAQLAAWYSRRKNDSLCPVTVTPKKFVRKPKGAVAGQVIVEREKVVLVTPANPFER